MTRFFIFVEGLDDERIFDKIVLREFNISHKIIRYGNTERPKIKELIQQINSQGKDYIYVKDNDHRPSIGERKQEIISQSTFLNPSKIIVVEQVIEGWYLAGLSEKMCKKLRIKTNQWNCNTIGEGGFNDLIPRNTERRIFLMDILDNYSLDVALSNSHSFNYIMDYLGNLY